MSVAPGKGPALAALAVSAALAAGLTCGVKAPPRPPQPPGVQGTPHDLRPEGPGADGGVPATENGAPEPGGRARDGAGGARVP